MESNSPSNQRQAKKPNILAVDFGIENKKAVFTSKPWMSRRLNFKEMNRSRRDARTKYDQWRRPL